MKISQKRIDQAIEPSKSVFHKYAEEWGDEEDYREDHSDIVDTMIEALLNDADVKRALDNLRTAIKESHLVVDSDEMYEAIQDASFSERGDSNYNAILALLMDDGE